MPSREAMPAVAAALLSAVAVTALVTVPALTRIEEAWNIVVVHEALALARLTFLVALAHAFVLGLPLFLLLRWMGRVGIVACALSGLVIGATPFGVLALTSMFGVQSASTGGTPTVIEGVPTLAGWIEYARTVGSMGLLGLAGGVTFWAARRSLQRVGATHGTDAPSSRSRAGAWPIAALAVLLSGAILILPSAVTDRSCHNLFRDGRTTLSPQVDADLKLRAEEWPALTRTFVDFGTAHALSFRSDQQIRDGTLTWRSLSLCNDAGVAIVATDRPWLAQIHSPLADRGISFGVYELKGESGWKPLARDLLNDIDMQWPRQTTFRGPDGKVISLPDALRGRPQP